MASQAHLLSKENFEGGGLLAGQHTLQKRLEEADKLLLVHGCYASKCCTGCLERMVSRSKEEEVGKERSEEKSCFGRKWDFARTGKKVGRCRVHTGTTAGRRKARLGGR